MTIWKPQLETDDGPVYLAIADALARDVEAGALCAGERLPTHRELAQRMAVNVGTVTPVSYTHLTLPTIYSV